MTLVSPDIDDSPLVNAGGLAEQSGLALPALATLLMDISQVAVPAVMEPADTTIVAGAVNVTVAVQPAPVTKDVAPAVNCNPAGNVSTNPMPA